MPAWWIDVWASRVRRSWRWIVLVAGLAVLVALPAIVRALPAPGPEVAPADVAAAIMATPGHPYQGYIESSGRLGLPDIQGAEQPVALLGENNKIRVWWSAPGRWRVDLLSTTGEFDTYADGGAGLVTWDSGNRRVGRVPLTDALRLPRAEDLTPPELARRLLASATPAELHPLGRVRVAGRSVPGVRIVPSSPVSTVDHIDIWADTGTGVALRVDVASKGVEEPALKTRFLDVSLAAPGPGLTTFVRPANARNARPTFDLAQQIERIQGLNLPSTIAGLDRQATTTPSSAIGLYGTGYSSLVVVAVPGFLVDRAIPSIITTETRPWGEARVITTPLVNVMAFTAGGIGYAVAGAVDLAELDRVAAALVGKGSGA